MIKGMYTSASGMIPRVQKQEMIANNVANAGTVGYKKDMMFFSELSKAEKKLTLKRSDWQQPLVDKTSVDFTPGTFDHTGNPLDLAIDGDGFFRLQGPDGDVMLTRSGTFFVNGDGMLSYPGGYLVLGEGGAVQVGDGTVTVNESGQIEVNGSVAARIVPVNVDDRAMLEKVGNAAFALPPGVQTTPVTTATIRQGYLETSNVDIVREMVDMIIAYRTYEANAKALQTQDSSLDSLFRKVASGG